MDTLIYRPGTRVAAITAPARATSGTLLLADISGYTAFLQAVNVAHGAQMAAMAEVPPAYPLMTSLLDSIAQHLTPPFTLSKFEGDAVFASASDADVASHGGPLLDCLATCYRAYRELRDMTQNLMPCDCDACALVSTLELKFVVHHGDFVVQSIAGREELFGPSVTMAHLLLKNTVAAEITRSAYALVTAPAVARLDVPIDGAVPHTEWYEHFPPMPCHVFRL